MNFQNKNILVIINDLKSSDLVLEKAYNIAQNSNALVEIVYVHESPFFDLPDLFLSQDQRGKDIIDLDKIKKSLENDVKKYDTNNKTAIFTYVDDSSNRVKNLLKNTPDTLLITTYHDHITKKLAQELSQAILIIKNNTSSYTNVSLLINFSNATECIDKCKKIFSNSTISLLYDYRYIIDPSMELDLQNVALIEQTQRENFERLKVETNLDGTFFIDTTFMNENLISHIKKIETNLLCICQEDSDLIDLVECDLYIKEKEKDMSILDRLKEALKEEESITESEKKEALLKVQEWYVEDQGMELLAKQLSQISQRLVPILEEIGLL